MLHDAVQVDELAIDVVDDFTRRRLRPEKIERCPTGENLDVAFVWREERDEPIGKSTLATEPGDDG